MADLAKVQLLYIGLPMLLGYMPHIWHNLATVSPSDPFEK
jgi:hypothetical protein